ncbi:ATP-binding protein [Roseivivax marinus]|uniref:ATP-binding protein n=1 Tax=Roseivivax marinus TaxID=1379903 RepID=UPI00273E72DA|nr:ATP-binding protein [Roseivivax marinus]
MTIFDIPSDRLVDLSDADLRELVARLCEAERERQGGHRNEVRWGGSQTAADGGLDVVVDPVGPFAAFGPLARRDVGIQVKAADLQPAAILTEMQYGGALRPSLSALAAKGGSYLIASAGANCSEIMLQRRIEAMQRAVVDDPNGTSLHLNFLDRNALGRWVSAHPSVAVWLRPRLALPILGGWQAYGRWSSTPAGVADDLVCEPGLAFRFGREEPIRGLPDALDRIRELLWNGTGAVRLAGLSGIGKSRIVQALFEPVGRMEALGSSHAIYTDLGDAPNPAPMAMLEALLAREAPAILVVDNCPPETHQALARKLAAQAGPVRLITVEYDVRTDRPEGTDIVRVEAEGADIVEVLVRRRHGDLAAGEARRIAELSQGNARLAFALAQAAPDAGTLSAFDDAALFDRLFWQREGRNDELARAAEALSLVYSFDFEGQEDPDELTFLGSLVALSRGAMHRQAADLLSRGLAQARSSWRAVLPHALANRLARNALGTVSWRSIADGFADKPRLRRSLARRLAFLHDSEEARRIVRRWMDAEGPLHGPEPDMQVLEAICHIAPEDSLSVINAIIERSEATGHGFDDLDILTRMICRIAHSEVLFPQACESLITLAIAVDGEQSANADDALANLFSLYLSGTTARTAARIAVARHNLATPDVNRNIRGVAMVRSALRTGQWSSSIVSEDDARPEALGWEPRGREVVEWYSDWLRLVAELDQDASEAVRNKIRHVFAAEIDGLWRRVPQLRERLDEMARQLHEASPWVEGWHSLRRMIHFMDRRGDRFPEQDMATLHRLVAFLAPADLVERTRSETRRGWELEAADDDFAAAEARRAERLRALGTELANSVDILRTEGRSLFEAEGRSLYPLGVGLAEGNGEPRQLWTILRDLHLVAPSRSRQVGLFSGFIHQLGEIDWDAAEEIRAECREVEALRRDYAYFLPQNALSAEELDHVVEIAGEAQTAAWQLTDVTWREQRQLTDGDRVRILRAFMRREDGPLLVVDALNMLRHVEDGARDVWPEALRSVGLDAISTLVESHELNANLDHDMARVLAACLRGENGEGANRIADVIILRASRRYGSTYDVNDTLGALAQHAPSAFLNRIFPEGANRPAIRFGGAGRGDPLSRISPEDLIMWCGQEIDRWARVAPFINPFSHDAERTGEAKSLSRLALAALDATPDPGAMTDFFFQHVAPMSWSGSRVAIIERRLSLLEALRDRGAPEIDEVIAQRSPGVRAGIERIRREEQAEDTERDQRFE